MRTSLIALAVCAGLAGCQTVETTKQGTVGVDRQQRMLVSEQEVNASAQKQYAQMMAEAQKKNALDRDAAQVARVKAITGRLVPQTAVFRPDAQRWAWEVHVLTLNEVNAWCMPGGKMAIYSGLIEKLHATDDELAAVMGHEMGHYALHHGFKLAFGFSLFLGIGYFVINRVFGRVQRRQGERWAIRDLADPAGLPLALAIFTIVMYLLTPATNTMTRLAEAQADAFGLDASKEPHGFASVAMRLSAYRKLEPGSLEEVIFYDHPSGRARVERSMRWLADHPPAN